MMHAESEELVPYNGKSDAIEIIEIKINR